MTLALHTWEKIPEQTRNNWTGILILNIKYGDLKIKQHNIVTYLGCMLDNSEVTKSHPEGGDDIEFQYTDFTVEQW